MGFCINLWVDYPHYIYKHKGRYSPKSRFYGNVGAVLSRGSFNASSCSCCYFDLRKTNCILYTVSVIEPKFLLFFAQNILTD